MLPAMQIQDLVSSEFFSFLSAIIPATMPETIPNTDSTTEFMNEYYALY